MALTPRTVQTRGDDRSARKKKIRLPSPAAIISHAVAENGSISGDFHFLASPDPKAQLKAPPCRLSDGQSSVRAKEDVDINCGHNSTTSPTIPSPMPTLPREEM